MNKLVLSLATMVGMFPSSNGKDAAMTMQYIQTWLKGIVFGLAAMAAIFALITGGAWIVQVIVPRLIGA